MSTASSAPRALRTGDARARALDVLLRVESEDSFAAAALGAALDRAPALEPAERALCTELVYGVLRAGPALDALAQRFAGRPGSVAALDPLARTALRLGAWQLLALDRVPPRAAVHASVELVKKHRSERLGGFVNALLRRIAEEGERAGRTHAQWREHLTVSSIPGPVVARVATVVGGEEPARAVLAAMVNAAHVQELRVHFSRAESADAVRAALSKEREGLELEAGRLAPGALRVLHGRGDLRSTEAFQRGLFAVMEEGSQAVALALGARPGERVLDACAGRGGKTMALADALRGKGTLHAAELHPHKVEQCEREAERFGLEAAGLDFLASAVDLTKGLGLFGREGTRVEGGYDRVLVDAPCSGLGTLGRRPDLLWRLHRRGVLDAPDEEDAGPERLPLPALQGALLDRVAPLVRAGGELLYAVCSLDRREGAEVLEAFRARHPGFEPCEGDAALPEALRPAAFVLRPDLHGTDGFQGFRLRRTG